jgi:glycosyltransferase involved in cell wall biosynthesis
MSGSSPKVSIVIPNFNHARFLRRRIESVLQQSFQDFELILLDDGSTDESRSILAQYGCDPRVRIQFNEMNSGSTFKQWNKGVELARGSYVWIAESDDYADQRLLAQLVAVLDDEPAVTFAYCRSQCVTEDDRPIGFSDFYLDQLSQHRWEKDFCVDGGEECRNYFVLMNPIPNASAVVFRKSTFECVGGADESLRLCGDWKLWAAMALAGKMAYLSETLNYYRFHETSVRNRSRKEGFDVTERLQVVRWISDRVTVPANVLENVYRTQAGYWVPAVLSSNVSLSLKSKIIRYAIAIDPHPFRSALRPAITTLRLKVSRHWGFARRKLWRV